MHSGKKLDTAIVILSLGFISILAISAYMEKEIRVLHFFQSFIYLAIILLSLKHSKWGYGIAISIALFWNTFNVFSGFIESGFREWGKLALNGECGSPQNLVAAPAALVHTALIICSIVAYLRLGEKKRSDIWIFLTSAIASITYMMLLIAIFWTDFLPQMRRIIFG
ncbi:hypothetical protein LLH00_05415 [bacterium]|nr:hypothetical protein [bacterium]